MGASSWHYFTAYKENVHEALEDLRQREFQAGRYYRPGTNLPDTFEEWIKQLNVPVNQAQQFREGFDQLKAFSEITPASIEELLELNQESGTHSILDIFVIGTSTGDEESGTITKKELIRLFGTEKPTHQMIQDKAIDLLDFRGRFFCTYVVVYKDGQPDELYFTGYSGD